jgi:hypothetical protein
MELASTSLKRGANEKALRTGQEALEELDAA